MAKRKRVPSFSFDSSTEQQSPLNSTSGQSTTSSTRSPRVTRSAARLAATESTEASLSRAPNPEPPPPKTTQKRRRVTADHNPESPPELEAGGLTRRSKRQKVQDREPSPPAPPRPRRGKDKQAMMSTPGRSDRQPDNEQLSIPQPGSSKRKPSRNKKSQDQPPSTPPQSSNHRFKKSQKKAEDVSGQEGGETTKPSSGPKSGGRKKMSREIGDEDLDSAHLPPEDEIDDGEDHSDPLRSFYRGRGGPGSFAQSLRALSGMMSGGNSGPQLAEILGHLRKKDDPSIQILALTELAQLLLVSNEDNLAGHFRIDEFVTELVTLMQPNDFGDENPEIMLLACRCIANLMEALPSSTRYVVHGDAVPILCQKLLEIHYIDVAEQALSTLEKVSLTHGAPIVEAGGLTACLTYLDFFATSTQRTAVTTAANCCRSIPHSSFNVVKDVMPILLNVLSSSDQKVVEQGSLCVSRIVESFRDRQDKLEELVSPDILRAILRLLIPGTTNLIGPNIHTQFLRVLGITARSSPKLSTELFEMDVVDTLYQILTGISPPEDVDDIASKIDGVIIMQALIHRPREQVYETLNVICELLPGMSGSDLLLQDALLISDYFGDDFITLTSPKDSKAKDSKRIELLSQCQDKVKRFVTILLPTLLHAYSSTVNLSVRRKVLTAQLKMLSNIETSILENALRAVPFASYLAAMLSQQEHPSLVIAALQAAGLLLARLGSIYGYQFFREGVMVEITKLANEPISSPPQKAKSTKDNGNLDLGKFPTSTNEINSKSSDPDDERGDEDKEDYDDMDDDMDDDEHDEEGDHEDDEDDEHDVHPHIHEDISPSPSDSSSDESDYHAPSIARSMKDRVTLRAKSFLEAHRDDQNNEMRARADGIMQDITSLGSKIRECYLEDKSEDGVNLCRKLALYFGPEALESMTSAELLNSGILDVLLDVLDISNDSLGKDARTAFIEVFMAPHALSTSTRGFVTAPISPFSVLVHKLHDVLSRTEHFEVVTVQHNSLENNRSGAASMLTKQLRLRLVADEESDIPKPYRNIMVSIHAIATFKALDDYLRPRMRFADKSRSGRSHELPGGLASFAAANGIPPPHRGFMEGGFEAAEPPSLPTPTAVKSKRPLRRLSKDKPAAATQTPQATSEEKTAPPRRSARRQKAAPAAAAPPPPDTSDHPQEPLECADEKQLSDEDNIDDENALDAFVEDLEEEMEGTPLRDPSAVSLEVASTGKVTAREEDGTRVPTPMQAGVQNGAQSSHPSRIRGGYSTPSSAARSMSYAAAIQSVPQDWHMEFSIDGRVIPTETTVYRAVHASKHNPDELTSRSVWSAAHTIKFKKAPGPPPNNSSSLRLADDSLSAIQDPHLPSSLHKHPTTSKILRLLNTLHQLNMNLDDVLDEGKGHNTIMPEPLAQFVNTKLTAKLNRQLEEPLIVASNCLPSWSEDLARLYPFLFPFETRYLFLQSTSFGYSRSMTRWLNAQSSDDSRRDRHRDERPFMGRLQRQKVRISRLRILESALKVLELYGSSTSVLEVEYFEEVGTGLGPTLEFYSSVSKEFHKKRTKLWRTDESNTADEFVFTKSGLFPGPMSAEQASSENGKKILHLFKMLGKFVARAMLDSRIIDISFNPMLFKLGDRRRPTRYSLKAIEAVDSDLASSLKLIKQFVQAQRLIYEDASLEKDEKERMVQDVAIHGVRVEDLGLDFTLPGYPSIELVDNGSNIAVTSHNVDKYLEKVIDFTLGSGVDRQIKEFQAGFSQVFPYSALRSFTPAELVMLFGRNEEDWSIETLMDSIKADHGFNMDSKSIKNLLQTMSELTPSQRRDFLQFVTGSPKLPIGGFKSLTPTFTVVCKPSEPPFTSDDYLPSVMTCVNYLKLPDYTDLEVMRTRLNTAIKEGQGAFHLS